MSATRTARNDDDGVVLVMVLAFITAVSIVSLALVSQVVSNLSFTRVERQNQKQVYAANAAIEYGIQQVTANNGVCPSPTIVVPFQVNGRTPTLACAATGSSSGGVNGSDWAIFLTGANGGPVVKLLATGSHALNGSLYNGYDGSWAQTWNINSQAPLVVSNGSVTQYKATCPLPAPIDNLGPTGLTVNCVTTPVPTPLPAETLAPIAPANAAAPVIVDANCKAFNPGRYTSAPSLDGSRVNFFRGGVYYFDGIGNWAIDSMQVLAGTPQLGEARQTALTCADAAQGGVMFVFGGNSTVSAKGSVLELFPSNVGGAGVSIYQVTGSIGGWNTSTTGNQPLVSVHQTGADRFVLHGQVWTPLSGFELQFTGNSNGTLLLRSGLVASDFREVIPGAATPSLNLVGTGSHSITLTGVGSPAGGETGGNVTATAVVVFSNDTTIAPRIASWRLS
jgi:hypothetical protein